MSRAARDEQIDLEDCLQLGDKGTVFAKSKTLFAVTGVESKGTWNRLCGSMEGLRNQLAHANVLASDSWPKIAKTAKDLEALLKRLEQGSASGWGLSR